VAESINLKMFSKALKTRRTLSDSLCLWEKTQCSIMGSGWIPMILMDLGLTR
jgi:hypothetical protein